MLEVRERLYSDFEFYANNALLIRTKDQKITPLLLNKAQRELLRHIEGQLERRKYVRIIILKGRQMGISTMLSGWLYWWVSQRIAQKALVVAHKADSSSALFDMTQRYHDKMPAILKPTTRFTNRKGLTFDKIDSSYMVVTAGGDSIVRGETITAAHLSELAFWPKSSAAGNFSGLMDAIPVSPGTAVFIESTANGMSGLFYEQCRLARSGQSDFEFVFLPWFWDPAYRVIPSPDFSHTPKEKELARRFGLDDAQLMFRRIKIAEKGEEFFKQEYPCDADEAFLTSGRPVFLPQRLEDMRQAITKPIATKALEGDEWNDHPLGELLCYEELNTRETYYIGADVGQGVQRDFSVAQVCNSKREQVAVWRGQVDPDYFGTILAHLGRYYNDAQVICERNGPGILTNRVLYKDENYPWVYQETVYDKTTDTETTHIGFLTSEKSKPLVINELRAHVRTGEITIRDQVTLDEMRSYIVTETGRMEAEKGSHDDTVIALALCDHINAGPWNPVPNSPDFYCEIE